MSCPTSDAAKWLQNRKSGRHEGDEIGMIEYGREWCISGMVQVEKRLGSFLSAPYWPSAVARCASWRHALQGLTLRFCGVGGSLGSLLKSANRGTSSTEQPPAGQASPGPIIHPRTHSKLSEVGLCTAGTCPPRPLTRILRTNRLLRLPRLMRSSSSR